MAKLITDHDPFHVHKILGVLVLLHILYRHGVWMTRGYLFCSVSNSNCTPQDIQLDVACNILHGILSWSSLLLPLPAKRNFSSPMIWKEFRWHSIIFASRAVIASIVDILGWWPANTALNYLSKLALVMATCYAADAATAKYGCSEKRTTNAMPYPDCITEDIQRGIKFNYALAQFNATLFCIIEVLPGMAWTSLIAIQGAPLLMTLVRKGKVTALTYHRGYILQLLAPVIVFALANLIHFNNYTWQVATLGFVVRDITIYMRIYSRCSKWTTWGVGVALINLFLQWPPAQHVLEWFHTTPLGWTLVMAMYTDFLVRRVICNFLPIFTLETYHPKMPEDYAKDMTNFVGKWNVQVTVGSSTSEEQQHAKKVA